MIMIEIITDDGSWEWKIRHDQSLFPSEMISAIVIWISGGIIIPPLRYEPYRCYYNFDKSARPWYSIGVLSNVKKTVQIFWPSTAMTWDAAVK